jgi:hypothetical protein
MTMSKRGAIEGARMVPARDGVTRYLRRDARKPVSSDVRKYRNQEDAQGISSAYNTGG